jgi:hypothetical protein
VEESGMILSGSDVDYVGTAIADFKGCEPFVEFREIDSAFAVMVSNSNLNFPEVRLHETAFRAVTKSLSPLTNSKKPVHPFSSSILSLHNFQ